MAKIIRLRRVKLFLCFSFFLNLAYAQYNPEPKGKWGIGINGGALIDLGPTAFKNQAGVGLGGGLYLRTHVSDSFGLQLNYDRLEFGKVRTYSDSVTASLIQRWMPHKRFSFLSSLGLGFISSRQAVVGDPHFLNLGLRFGVGIEWWCHPQWAFGISPIYFASLKNTPSNNELHTLGITANLTWYLGSKENKQPEEQKPLTPIEEPDTDQDGIINRLDKCPQTKLGEDVNDYGCAEEETAEMAIDVHFATGRATILPESWNEIARLAEFLKKYPKTKASIEGHTDALGEPKRNLILSQERALAVMKALIEKEGISATRLSSVGFGSTRPIADNQTSEGRSKNRRVMVRVSEKK